MQDDCIPYDGAVNEHGYGVLPGRVHGSRLAHRAALAEKLGRPVIGFALHHCDNPPCINQDHLYEGTQAENMADAVRRGRTRGRFTGVVECVKGHPFSGDNLILKNNPRCKSGLERVCRACRTIRNRQQAARRKAARAARKVRHG